MVETGGPRSYDWASEIERAAWSMRARGRSVQQIGQAVRAMGVPADMWPEVAAWLACRIVHEAEKAHQLQQLDDPDWRGNPGGGG